MMYEIVMAFLLGFGLFLVHQDLTVIRDEVRRMREEFADDINGGGE